MKTNLLLIKSAVLAAFVVSLAACTDMQSPPGDEPVHVTATPADWRGIMSTSLVTNHRNGSAANPSISSVALGSKNQLRKLLSDFYVRAQGDPADNNIGRIIGNIRNANRVNGRVVPGMTGLGGVFGHALLNRSKAALNGNNFNAAERMIVTIAGQINYFEFRETSGINAGDADIVATTYITWKKVSSGLGNPPAESDAYRYTIAIRNNGFKIVEIGNDPNDPFPGTMNFTEDMKKRTVSLGFKYKLWAEGTDIRVTKVERKKNGEGSYSVLT